MDISRREAVQRLTMLVGGALSGPTISAILSGCEAAQPSADWTPRVLSANQMDLIRVAVDHIIPPTDTPGASDVGVPGFIDLMLDEWAGPRLRERFLAGVEGLNSASEGQHGAAFTAIEASQQLDLLRALDREAVQARKDEEDPLPFFATLKEWTLTGYYTSEAGATQELQWIAAPGRWDADVPLEEVGRTWA